MTETVISQNNHKKAYPPENNNVWWICSFYNLMLDFYFQLWVEGRYSDKLQFEFISPVSVINVLSVSLIIDFSGSDINIKIRISKTETVLIGLSAQSVRRSLIYKLKWKSKIPSYRLYLSYGKLSKW